METKELKFENCKVRINSEEESRKVQNKLFELGYAWPFDLSLLSHLNEPFLYLENARLLYGTDEEYFVINPSKEITVAEIIGPDYSKVAKFLANKYSAEELAVGHALAIEKKAALKREIELIEEIAKINEELKEVRKVLK